MMARALAVLAAGLSLGGLAATAAVLNAALQARPGGPPGLWAQAGSHAILAAPYLIGVACAVAARRAAIPAAAVFGGCLLVALLGSASWRVGGRSQVEISLLQLQTWCFQMVACAPVLTGGLRGRRAIAEQSNEA